MRQPPAQLKPANLLTRAVFEGYANVLRRLHAVERAEAYKYMQECSCPECPGNASGRPSTLHQLEKEMRAGLKISHDKAKEAGTVPDYTALRQFAQHPAHYLDSLIQEQSQDGFGSDETRCEKLKRIVSEHADVVKAGISREPDAKQLEEAEQLLSALEDYVTSLRGEVKIQARLRMVNESRRSG